MALTRRQFLTVVGGGALGAVVAAACGVPEDELFVQSPPGMPEDLVTGLDNWYATVASGFPTGEGVVVRVMEGRAKKVEGNVDYPVNRGQAQRPKRGPAAGPVQPRPHPRPAGSRGRAR